MVERPEIWDEYERAVMAGESDVPTPPQDYEMSTTFQEWVLERMRKDVMAQVAGAGLDRMAVVVDPSKASEGAEEDSNA